MENTILMIINDGLDISLPALIARNKDFKGDLDWELTQDAESFNTIIGCGVNIDFINAVENLRKKDLVVLAPCTMFDCLYFGIYYNHIPLAKISGKKLKKYNAKVKNK